MLLEARITLLKLAARLDAIYIEVCTCKEMPCQAESYMWAQNRLVLQLLLPPLQLA